MSGIYDDIHVIDGIVNEGDGIDGDIHIHIIDPGSTMERRRSPLYQRWISSGFQMHRLRLWNWRDVHFYCTEALRYISRPIILSTLPLSIGEKVGSEPTFVQTEYISQVDL